MKIDSLRTVLSGNSQSNYSFDSSYEQTALPAHIGKRSPRCIAQSYQYFDPGYVGKECKLLSSEKLMNTAAIVNFPKKEAE
jgi:hypothetical protein